MVDPLFFLKYATPWLGLVETYVTEGEIETDDWLTAIASTVGAAIDGYIPDTTPGEFNAVTDFIEGSQHDSLYLIERVMAVMTK
jgi:hypothetical protein